MVPRGDTQRMVSAARALRPKPPIAATDTPAAVNVSNRRRPIFISVVMISSPQLVLLSNSRLPARPFLAEPEEEHIDGNADDRENENDREELRHADERGIVGEPVAKPFGASHHFRPDRGQKTED